MSNVAAPQIHAEKSTLRGMSGVPPWIWIWAAIFVLSLPSRAVYWMEKIQTWRWSYFSALAFDLPDVLVPAAVALGLIAVLFPWIRAAYVEKYFRLSDPPQNLPVLEEILAFLRGVAPHLRVKTNLVRVNDIAFVYPNSYRRATVALLGGCLKMWRADREAAQAVLLHEIGHWRHGNVLIVGVGSFFERMVKLALSVCILLVVISGILASVIMNSVFSFILSTPVFFSKFIALLVLPVAVIWVTELDADRFAIEQQRSAAGLDRALSSLTKSTFSIRQFMSGLSHPPINLRRWIIRNDPHARCGLICLLLALPLAYLARFIVLQIFAILGYVMSSQAGLIWKNTIENTVNYIIPLWPILITVSGFLAIWPLASSYWEFFFSGERRAADRSISPTYFACSIGVGGLALISFYIGLS